MRVLICDDHSLFAEAIAAVLTHRGISVVGCVTTPAEAVRVVEEGNVDICIMDLGFPAGSGIEATARIARGTSGTQVVVLTGCSDPDTLTRAAGAHAIASKDDDLHRLVDTLEGLTSGKVAERHVGRRPSRLPGPAAAAPDHFLTPRELEVLEHLSRGASTADLAKAIGRRYSTARTHIQNILTKLGVHSKLEAVVYAVNNGIVPRPERGPEVARH